MAKVGNLVTAFPGGKSSAQGLVKAILQNAAKVTAGAKTVDAYNSTGQGVRGALQTGRFIGFLDASKATR